jgi:hypothetical protein
MTETGPDLSFDKATYASPAGEAASAVPCGNCKQPLGEQYWTWQRHMVCARCRDVLAATMATSRSASAFGKAVFQGGLAALACGAAYATFVGVTNIQIAFATIGIAVVIAKVVRKASRGVSGRRFQVLAVALTYLASTMGYAPGIIHALRSSGSHHTAASGSEGSAPPSAGADRDVSPAATAASGTDGQAVASKSGASGKAAGPLDVIVALAYLLGIMLAAPFLELTEAPIGVVIVLIGLWQAWKLSRGVPTTIDGPFRSVPQAAGASAP